LGAHKRSDLSQREEQLAKNSTYNPPDHLTGTGAAFADEGEHWDYETDVVVAGAGCAGLTAALRAIELGSSVLVVDQNFDVGGRMLHSGAYVSLGGGDAIQKRDAAGLGDPEGFISVPPKESPAALNDNVDLLFVDQTDWSIVDPRAYNPHRYSERGQSRAWAENCPPTRDFLMRHYVRFSRIEQTHGGGGLSRARAAYCFLMLGSVTDIPAGTITLEDAGRADPERTSHMAPTKMEDASQHVGPNAVRNGVALARPLEFSAREKGVKFILNRHFDELIQDSSGRVIGISAHYTPRISPQSGERLESLWSNGNIDERREVVRIRARKAVVLASGGHAGNPEVRSMFYPAMRDPAWTTSGYALLGPHAQDASALIAGLKIGANLAGMHQNFSYATFHISTRLGTRDAYSAMFPGHPTFPFRGSTGLDIGRAGFEHLIVVNQVGKRFFNEWRFPLRLGISAYPGGPSQAVPNPGLSHIPRDWRNCRPEWIRQSYNYEPGLDAALAINEGSRPPEYYSGPIWAIFDSDAVMRNPAWQLRFPYVNERNGYFFKADTLEELASKIFAGHPFQRVPMAYLVQTVTTWNSYVTSGVDPEFERHAPVPVPPVLPTPLPTPPMHPIQNPPFYALSVQAIWHDSYGGLRVNGRQQVIDMKGQPIPGLYAGGEAVGGIGMHGLGRCHVHGFIAGTQVAGES
jgi:hypothetical protein